MLAWSMASQVRLMRKRLVAANWKLNGSRQFAVEFLDTLLAGGWPHGTELAIFPPLPYLAELIVRYTDSGFRFGAQAVCRNKRSEERSAGTVCFRQGRSLWLPQH